MLRRHVVNESDVAELCRKLYRAHKKAFDLILEYRQDLQSNTSEAIGEILDADPSFGRDHWSKSYLRFYPKQWEGDPRQKSGSGWTKSGRVLLFQVENFERSMRLILIVGPGDQEFRDAIYQRAKSDKEVFRGCIDKLYPKWTMIYAHPILRKQDYERDTDDLVAHVKTEFTRLLRTEVPAILEALKGTVG